MTEKATEGQDAFLDEACRSRMQLAVFLQNGVRLQGTLTSHDRFCLLLERDGQTQLVYKHAISSMGDAASAPPRTMERGSAVIVERRGRGGPMR